MCDKHRKYDGSYDCIVPGSGGKDSFYASHILKNKYKMNPLTVTWAPHIYTNWGWKNFQSWIHSGNDNYLMTPNGKVHRLLTRLSTELLFHPFQPFMFGQKTLAPKMASLFKIPLVFLVKMKQNMEIQLKIQILPREIGLILQNQINLKFLWVVYP